MPRIELTIGLTADMGRSFYSQLVRAEALKGQLPLDAVSVANVAAVEAGGRVVLDFERLFNVLKVWESALPPGPPTAPSSPYTVVVNLSFAGGRYPQPFPPLSGDHRPRLLVVVAAGNDTSDNLESVLFASQNNVTNSNLFVVGALAADGKTRASYSNYDGRSVDIYAQGSCLCGVGKQLNGTSQAAPVVATAAAYIAAQHPTWGPQEVKWRLISTADMPKDFRTVAIGGLLNFRRALHEGPVIRYAAADRPEVFGTKLLVDHTWHNVLTANWKRHGHSLLRISRVPCTSEALPDESCFSALRRAAPPSWNSELVIDNGATMQVQDNGKWTKITARELNDLVFPLDYVLPQPQ